MPNGTEQLRRYAQTLDQDAFAEFVHDHLTLVYSAAYRQTYGNAHLAEELTQAVFVRVASHADKLASHPVIQAWLHQTTRNVAIDALRAERSRKVREREAAEMSEPTPPSDSLAWDDISPELDRAISALKEDDREAVILRFFGNASFPEIGDRLGLSENAARMRVDRALDKLRVILGKGASVSGAAALAALISENAAVAAPTGLASTVTAAAISSTTLGASVATTTTLKILAAMKLATAFASIVALASLATAVYQYQRANKAEEALANAPKAQVVADLAAAKAKKAAAAAAHGATGQGSAAPATEASRKGSSFAAVLAIFNNPSVYQQQSMMVKARLDAQYGPLFKSMKLTPDQVDAFKNLIVEKQMAGFDTLNAAREQGIDFQTDPKAMYMAMVATEKTVNGKISDLIGSDNFGQFQSYEQTIPARNTATLLSQALDYTDTPITSDQQQQIVKVLTDAGTPPVPIGNPFAVFNSDLGVTKLSQAGQDQLQTILNPSQYQALQAKIAQQAQIVEVRKNSAKH